MAAHKIGAFLVQAAFQGNVITSAMFLTAMAANPLAAKLAGQMHINVTWGQWALAAIVPGITSLVLIPLILYQLYPPEIKETPGASEFAKQKLAEMGKMRSEEWTMLAVFFSVASNASQTVSPTTRLIRESVGVVADMGRGPMSTLNRNFFLRNSETRPL